MFLEESMQHGVINELTYSAIPNGQEGESGEGDTDDDDGQIDPGG